MKKIILILSAVFLLVPLFGQRYAVINFLPKADSGRKDIRQANDAYRTPKKIITKFRKVIIRSAEKNNIPPDLLADVVFVETYAGGVESWYELKNKLSFTKQYFFGNATIGITQVRPENIRRLDKLVNYYYDEFWQLSRGALQLASVRDAIYPNTPILSEERKMNVLRYYNQGMKAKIYEYSLEENPVAHYALCHYKKNLRIRKRRRINNEKPFYSNEISVYNAEKKAMEIYVFNILVAEYSIGGSRNKANNYAWTAYVNRERIRNWLSYTP